MLASRITCLQIHAFDSMPEHATGWKTWARTEYQPTPLKTHACHHCQSHERRRHLLFSLAAASFARVASARSLWVESNCRLRLRTSLSELARSSPARSSLAWAQQHVTATLEQKRGMPSDHEAQDTGGGKKKRKAWKDYFAILMQYTVGDRLGPLARTWPWTHLDLTHRHPHIWQISFSSWQLVIEGSGSFRSLVQGRLQRVLLAVKGGRGSAESRGLLRLLRRNIEQLANAILW